MSESKFAKAVLKNDNGCRGFDLVMGDRSYGFYPLDNNHEGASQMQMAIRDAEDYGFSGVIFENATNINVSL